MPITLLTILILAQAPAATQPAQPNPPIDVTAKKKKKQDCKVIELTGSRMQQRVCRDDFGDFNYGPGVSEAAPNSGMIHAPPPATPPAGSIGGPPR